MTDATATSGSIKVNGGAGDDFGDEGFEVADASFEVVWVHAWAKAKARRRPHQ